MELNRCADSALVMKWLRVIILLPLCGLIFYNCGGNTRAPFTPETPVFTLDAQPPAISPPENALIYMRSASPAEFSNLMNMRVYFTCTSGGGIFTPDSSRVDTNAVTGMTPAVWYNYTGTESNFADTLYAHCVDVFGQLLAWNYCLIQILGNQ